MGKPKRRNRREWPGLYALAREIVEGIIKERGSASDRAFALEIGIRQQTFFNFRSGTMKNGPTARFLTEIIDGVGMDPVEFFSRHPLLGISAEPLEDSELRLARKLIEALGGQAQAIRLLRLLDVFAERNRLDTALGILDQARSLLPEYDTET